METKQKNETKKTRTAEASMEIYRRRFARHFDELKWLYTELYHNSSMFAELCDNMERFYQERSSDLRMSDLDREERPDWYKQNDMMGMMFYIDNFAGNMQGVEAKLDYIEDCNVNYIHLMPFLETPKGRSDGGYAVADFRKVQENLGTMEDLESLTSACHRKGINVCMDFVMNHTSEDHEWAKRARQGDGEYMSRYFFFDNWSIPSMFEETVPQVFPTTAPGNFTWLPEAGHYVMTTFYPYQWDLNYRNPRVFNEMMYNFLYLANRGIDIIRIDAVPYIWKELGTSCRNLKQVHTIVRMMRMIGEIVCPGILLLGEVVMEPEKVVPYFGTVEKPECHMLYNVTTMATTWHTVATRDAKLLKKQLDIVNALPKDYVFLNYLRCHDDIGWGLDYATLAADGMDERSHKQYLNDYFQGYAGESTSRGELYNSDPVTGDARFCGTTASMCGVEKAAFEHDPQAMERAVRFDVTLHAYMFMQSGIPVLYSGDEIGQLNDYTYKDDPDKAEDSRYIHRGKLDWDLAALRNDPTSVQGRIFQQLKRLEEIRKSEKAFVSYADSWTLDTWDQGVLCMGRYYDGDKIIGIFNFSENDRTAWINETDGDYVDMISGQEMKASGINVPAYGFYYLKKKTDAGKARDIRLLEQARLYEETAEKKLNQEERPAFHLATRVGWMNDPNGFSYYQGQYHMFYQYYPYDPNWGPMHWGHAVSQDLLHWEYLPAALAPDEPYDQDGCFSGNAVELPDGRQLLMYTGVRKFRQPDGEMEEVQTQCVAVGDGIDYEKYEGNPVLNMRDLPKGASFRDFRDPKLWQTKDGSYRCVAANRAADGTGQILLFGSPDGFHWSFRKVLAENKDRFGKMWECPDFFPLDGGQVLLISPQDMKAVGHEYHNGDGTVCLIGEYDEEKEIFTEKYDQAVDYGIDFYAPQTVLTPDGRRIMIGWMQNWDVCLHRNPSQEWYGQMSLPRELSVRGGRLIQQPLRELETMRGEKVEYSNVKVQDAVSLAGVEGRRVDMELEIRPGDARKLYQKFEIRFAQDGQYYTSVSFRPHEALLKMDRNYSGTRQALLHECSCQVRDGQEGKVKLRIILDRCSAEVFVNDGEQVMTITLYTDQTAQGISFLADGKVLMDLVKYELV